MNSENTLHISLQEACTARLSEMRQELKTDPEYESIIPKLTDEEFKQLEENLLADGVLAPLIVWNGTIVDGHNRYRIAQKHHELQYEVVEKTFADRYACLAWICKNQLGRRNLTPENRKYLIGKRYGAEKMSHGGARNASSVQNEHLKTGVKIAAETNTSESFVRRADQFAKGVDAGEAVVNGFRDVVLAGEAKVSDYEIASIATCPEQERRQLVEELLKPKEKSESRKSKKQSEAEDCFSEPEIVATYDIAAEIPLRKVNDPTDEVDIEDNILDSMSGTVSMFISSCNNYFARFPKLQTEKRYKDRALEILGVAKKFVMDVEGVLK